jgi:hypothetical protein
MLSFDDYHFEDLETYSLEKYHDKIRLLRHVGDVKRRGLKGTPAENAQMQRQW